jgi:hypothetical protein
MTSIADSPVTIQTSPQSVPSTPSWLGEVTLLAHYLRHQDILSTLEEHVRFARRRFGHYDVIDFVAVLLGYAISGERTLETFYERVQPFADTFMALFGRDHLPARSTLSRFLASLDQAPVEALRSLFLTDLLARSPLKAEKPGGLWDRQGTHWLVFDVDGTREAARQRALPQTPDRPTPQRRLRPICAPGYTGRKRGEVIRTRTTVWAAPIPISGSPPLAAQATASIGQSCVGRWRRSRATRRRTTSQKSEPSSVWMGNMAREPSWRIWQTSPM